MTQPAVSAAANTRGIIAMLCAMGAFIVNDTMVKLASGHFPIGQMMAIRAFCAFLITLGLVAAFGAGRDIGKILTPVIMIRAGIEGLVALLFVTALTKLPIANVTTLMMATSPILTVLSVMLGLEKVGWRRMLAVAVGFLGVVVALRPTVDGFNIYSLMALAAAALIAIRELLTRRIATSTPTVVITLSTTVISGLIGLLMGLGETWAPLAVTETSMLVVAALSVSLGSYAIIMAYRGTDVSVVSGYRYTIVVFALIVGYLVWRDIPDGWSLTGAALIVGSGLYTLHRERVRRLEAPAS